MNSAEYCSLVGDQDASRCVVFHRKRVNKKRAWWKGDKGLCITANIELLGKFKNLRVSPGCGFEDWDDHFAASIPKHMSKLVVYRPGKEHLNERIAIS